LHNAAPATATRIAGTLTPLDNPNATVPHPPINGLAQW